MNVKHETWGILGALDREVALLLEQLTLTRTVETLGTTFHFGTLHGHAVVVACCGVGKVNAAMCAGWMIDVAGCTRLINVGIAGAVGARLRTLDVVISRELCFHDQDAVMLKYFPKQQFFAADPELLARCRQVCAEPGCVHGTVREGRIATGDRFVNDRATREAIVAACAPDCVEMEGAAIAHVAFAHHVPFLVIRTMSDCADDDTEATYDDFLERAANQSAHIILALLRATPKTKRHPSPTVRRLLPVGMLVGLLAIAWGLSCGLPPLPKNRYARAVESLTATSPTAAVMAAVNVELQLQLTQADVDAWRALVARGHSPRAALRTVAAYRTALAH